jgi:Rrf2 family protein
MRINTSTHYAIRVMLYLAEQKRIVPSAELSEAIQISQRYSMQIIAKLRDGGIIGTTMGMSGGYALLKEPSRISVYDIVTLMEGVVNIPGSAADMPDGSKLHDALRLLKDYVETYLRSMTLDRLTDENTEDRNARFTDMVESHIALLKGGS